MDVEEFRLPKRLLRHGFWKGGSQAPGGVLRLSPRVRPRHAVDLCQQPSVGARYVPVSARNRCAVDFSGTIIVMQACRYKTYAIDGVVPVIDPTAFVHPDVLQGVRLTVRSH
jgi:hypothetical protein